MVYLPKGASKARVREAQNARNNRAEIVKALSLKQITKRDLFKWGIFTASGVLAAKHGLSPYAPSALASVPTGTPRSPLFGADKLKFTHPLVRFIEQKPTPLTRTKEGWASWGMYSPEPPSKRLSYHTDYSKLPANTSNPFRNPITGRGPMEGRPPGEFFAHQRWDEFFPKVGYVFTLGCQEENTTRFCDEMPWQHPNCIWSFGSGSYRSNGGKAAYGTLPMPLIRARYGEPMIIRVYNGMPQNPEENEGFGRNESSLHFHNAHNGAESDGAMNGFHFPGTFYDYRWSTTLARRDKINTGATDRRASGPDDGTGLKLVPGDYRELQGTMWYHDHRFFYTAENVYKGHAGVINYYSGPDRGHETLTDGVNLKLPSGFHRKWGNIDFDVNLAVMDMATKQDGQLFFDIFDTEGFLGDMLLVNHQYAPYFEVLPRKYRFRILNACVARFVRLVLADSNNKPVAITQIANDGNLFPTPVTLTGLDEQSPAERYDIIVDFSRFKPGDKLRLINVLQQTDGRKPDGTVALATAAAGITADPAVGPVMEFRVVSEIASVDAPGQVHKSSDFTTAIYIPPKLTDQIPVQAPVRERVIEFGRSGGGDSRDPVTGKCQPDCPENMPFPWSVKVNGQAAHTFNANRISLLIPKPGEIEHWTYINGGGGWDHPIHLHFEEGLTLDRPGGTIGPAEKFKRKDVWRLRPGGKVKFQVQFGEYGGSYVNHCHNTVHEDFAMLLRYQILGNAGTPQLYVTPTPNPTLDGVYFTTPFVLPEGDPRAKS